MEFYGYDGSDWDAILLVNSPYAGLYKYYVMAQIDMMRSENSKYNSDLAQFNDNYQEYANWYNRTHMSELTRIPLRLNIFHKANPQLRTSERYGLKLSMMRLMQARRLQQRTKK